MNWTHDALSDPGRIHEARNRADWQQWLLMARQYTTADFTGRMLLQHAQGSWMTLADGSKLLDLLSGYGVVATGWNHPRIVEAMRESAEFAFAPPFIATQQVAQLAHRMLEVFAIPEGWSCARATGGGDANEQVLKALGVVARERGLERFRIARFARSYHGGTSTMLALSDASTFELAHSLPVEPHPMLQLPTCVEAIKELEQLLDDDDSILGVIVEPVLGSGGVIPLDSGYLRRLRELCTAREMYLIFDEVITGCGRTGSMLACHSLGFWPDAITLGKGLTSGAAALGAALLCPELAKAMGRIQDTSSTFAWTPSACCICAANLEVIEGEFLAAKADLLGHEFALRLQGVIDRAVPGRFELKSAGMMLGLWPNCEEQQRPRVIRRLNINAQRRGLFVGASWDWQSCVLLPPLTITRSECDIACEKLADALTST